MVARAPWLACGNPRCSGGGRVGEPCFWCGDTVAPLGYGPAEPAPQRTPAPPARRTPVGVTVRKRTPGA